MQQPRQYQSLVASADKELRDRVREEVADAVDDEPLGAGEADAEEAKGDRVDGVRQADGGGDLSLIHI